MNKRSKEPIAWAMVLGTIIAHLIASSICAAMWFSCDDSLAEFVGVPKIGEVPFVVAWLLPVVTRWVLTTLFGTRAALLAEKGVSKC